MTDDQEALFAKFLDYLHSEPTPPEYWGEPPESTNSFDTYQMVAEWTALRHELKQQGKLWRSTQDTLQQALAVTRAQQEQLEASQKQALAQFESQQEKLLKELLEIVDALDRACNYWQEELAASPATSNPKPARSTSFWEKLKERFGGNYTQSKGSEESFSEIIASHQQGVELIRRSLLEILRQRRVVPIATEGKSFDSQTMYAVGREARTDIADRTAIQEVVRGYLWGDRILREAQVIVATREIKE
jgi:molecular chaperone GrpE